MVAARLFNLFNRERNLTMDEFGSDKRPEAFSPRDELARAHIALETIKALAPRDTMSASASIRTSTDSEPSPTAKCRAAALAVLTKYLTA